MNKPFVSIIIPVYNCEAYLERCLDSVFKQDYDNYEVICIDDGSTDNSKEILSKYNVRYYYQDNAGQAVARNKGIELAKGEWICFVDGDDAIKSNYLSKMVDGIKEGCNMVVCHINRINENGSRTVDVLKKKRILNAKEALVTVNIGPTNKLIKKDIVGNSRFDENGRNFEDIVFTPEVIINAKKINVINDALYDYYVRDNSTMRRFDDSLDNIFVVLDKLMAKPFYKEYKDEIDYLVFKNGLFGHLSRIVYFDKEIASRELKKAEDYIRNRVPNYWNNKYIRNDKQSYFYVGARMFKMNKLHLLLKPLKLMEKRVNR